MQIQLKYRHTYFSDATQPITVFFLREAAPSCWSHCQSEQWLICSQPEFCDQIISILLALVCQDLSWLIENSS